MERREARDDIEGVNKLLKVEANSAVTQKQAEGIRHVIHSLKNGRRIG